VASAQTNQTIEKHYPRISKGNCIGQCPGEGDFSEGRTKASTRKAEPDEEVIFFPS